MFPGPRFTVIPRSTFVFDRQRIVIAGEDSVVIAFVVETLRGDGHCVTQTCDAESARWDAGVRDCHLLITGSGISGMGRSDLIADLRERAPTVAVLCLAGISGAGSLEAGPQCEISALREPFTAEQLRAAVRPLLPRLRLGSVLAREAKPPRPT